MTEELIERDARLFEAGVYEDKGMEVTEADLDVMIGNFVEVPVRVEHTDTPFDGALGVLKTIYRKGKELWGKIGFTPAAWALAQAAGALKLSVGMLEDKSRVMEVSLVREPRIAGAQVFSEGVVVFSEDFDAGATSELTTPDKPAPDVEPEKEVATMSETEKTTQPVVPPTMDLATALRVLRENATNPDAAALFKANQDLLALVKTSDDEVRRAAESARAVQAEMQRMAADHLIAKFKREGKITPAAETFARAILAKKPLASATLEPDQSVQFAVKDGAEDVEKTVHFAQAFEQFLEAMAPAVHFSEAGLMSTGGEQFTPEQIRMAAKLGVSSDDLSKYSTARRGAL